MKIFNPKFLFKLFLSLLLAFLVSEVFVTKVTYKESPVLRPSFQQFVHNLPTKTVSQIKKIPSFLSHLPLLNLLNPLSSQSPPPWIEPVIKPTIISYQPPVHYPPASPPQGGPASPDVSQGGPTSTPRPLTPTPRPSLSSPPSLPSSPSPTSTPSPSPTKTPESPPSQKKAQLLNLINQERGKNGTAALSYHNALDNAAQGHADDMNQYNYFSHIGRDGSTPADRALRAGYSSSAVGENIAKGTTNPTSIFNMWMQSTGHRQNMLNPNWKSTGIGFSGNVWVLMLGAK